MGWFCSFGLSIAKASDKTCETLSKSSPHLVSKLSQGEQNRDKKRGKPGQHFPPVG